MKKFLVGMGVAFLLIGAGCGTIEEVVETSQKKDAIVIMRTVGAAEVFTQKKTISDEDMIHNVRQAFAEADWQAEELKDVGTHPDYRIETFDIWLPDQVTQVKTQDTESEEYALLSEEQSEVIVQLIIHAYH